MGDTKHFRKNYATPTHPWEDNRIDDEQLLMDRYGLKTKEEIWRMKSLLKGFKDQVKKLNATSGPQAEREERQLMQRVRKLGLVTDDDSMDDVLALSVDTILDRRLQTRVHKEGLARTAKQARQFVVHEHIVVDGDTVDVPSYLVETGQEISFAADSPFSDDMHPERVEQEPETHELEEDKEDHDAIKATEDRKADKQRDETMGFHEDVVPQVLDGKTKTYRLRQHDTEEGDILDFVNSQSEEVFGEGELTDIEETTVGEIDLQDESHGATYDEVGELISAFEKHYPDRDVTEQSTAYIYTYDFTPTADEAEDEPGDPAPSDETAELPARSTVENKTKDEIKRWAEEEYGVELSTNDLKDEMIDQLFEEVEDGE